MKVQNIPQLSSFVYSTDLIDLTLPYVKLYVPSFDRYDDLICKAETETQT